MIYLPPFDTSKEHIKQAHIKFRVDIKPYCKGVPLSFIDNQFALLLGAKSFGELMGICKSNLYRCHLNEVDFLEVMRRHTSHPKIHDCLTPYFRVIISLITPQFGTKALECLMFAYQVQAITNKLRTDAHFQAQTLLHLVFSNSIDGSASKNEALAVSQNWPKKIDLHTGLPSLPFLSSRENYLHLYQHKKEWLDSFFSDEQLSKRKGLAITHLVEAIMEKGDLFDYIRPKHIAIELENVFKESACETHLDKQYSCLDFYAVYLAFGEENYHAILFTLDGYDACEFRVYPKTRQTVVITSRGNVGEIFRSIGKIGWWESNGYLDEEDTLNQVEEELRSEWLMGMRSNAYQCSLEMIKRIQANLGLMTLPGETTGSTYD